mgnify:CR=1 FL=1
MRYKAKSIVRNQKVTKEKVELSRKLRKDMTVAEKAFWKMVRNRKLFNLKFRRQQIIDGFIVDFYCDELGLCIEIDGEVHNDTEQKQYDRYRDEAIALNKLKILRFTNNEVLYDKDMVEIQIKELMGV